MEVLAGARDDAHFQRLRRMLFGCDFLSMTGPADYEDSAALYRRCRQAGTAPRSLTDCLIATVAIRSDVELLHADKDFHLIAQHSSLRIASG